MPLVAWPSVAKTRAKVPEALLTRASLLEYLKIDEPELKKIWRFRHRMYSVISLKKKSGGQRTIAAPDKRLKHIQRMIYQKIKEMYIPRHPVHGFVENRSVKTNAGSHIGRNHILNLDLKDFFPSISENRVAGLFKSLGFDKEVSEIVARLCCLNDALPQGAPTSPIISNMICFKMDREFLSFCKDRQIRYTRYADDLTFSMFSRPHLLFSDGPQLPGVVAAEKINAELQDIVIGNGFQLNEGKIRYSGPTSRRKVTGCIVNEFVNVPRIFVEEIRAILHKIEKFGLPFMQAEYLAKYKKVTSLEQVIRGKISWLGFIKGQGDPVYRRYADRFNKIFIGNLINIKPTEKERMERSIWVVEFCYDGETEVKSSQGTAFFLKDVGLVTAFHCVEGGKDIEIYHPTKPANKFPVSVAKHCTNRDLALLAHTVSLEDYFELDTVFSSVQDGDPIVALGYPAFGVGDGLSRRAGNVNSISMKGGIKYIEVSPRLSPGISGGPLLNADKKVVGIAHKGGQEEGKDLAVSIEELKSWLGI